MLVRVCKPVKLCNLGNMFFIEPLQYMEFVYLMEKCHIVLTDSGGIQEEAPGLGKPVLVMRDTTERPEALEAGTVKLVGTNHVAFSITNGATFWDSGYRRNAWVVIAEIVSYNHIITLSKRKDRIISLF